MAEDVEISSPASFWGLSRSVSGGDTFLRCDGWLSSPLYTQCRLQISHDTILRSSLERLFGNASQPVCAGSGSWPARLAARELGPGLIDEDGLEHGQHYRDCDVSHAQQKMRQSCCCMASKGTATPCRQDHHHSSHQQVWKQ